MTIQKSKVSSFIVWLNCILIMICSCKRIQYPPIEMNMLNGKLFSSKSIAYNQPFVVVYFSPECQYCNDLISLLLRSKIHHVDIIMITNTDLSVLKQFNEKYHISERQNIYLGTESFRLTSWRFFKIKELPFIAMYNSAGQELATYNRTDIPSDIIVKINKLDDQHN